MSRDSYVSSFPAASGRPLPWTLLILAGPIIASLVSRTAMGLVDFIMVSRLGTEAQAAIVPAGIVLFTLIAFGFGVVSAVNTLVSQCYGRQKTTDCAAYTWQGVWVSAVLGVFALALWPAVPAVIGAAGHAPEVERMEIAYIQIGLLAVFPVVGAAAVANFFNGIHRPMIGLWATLIANTFNVAANYALIFGHWGFPAMGLEGAAWATTISAGINLSMLLLWFVRPSLNQTYAVRAGWRFQGRRTLRVLRIGLPAGVHFAAAIGALTVFTLSIVGRFGTAELAANNITMKFFEVASIPCAGMGIAVSSAVGKAIGEGDLGRARRFAHGGVVMGMGYLAAASVFFLLTGPELVSALTENPAVVKRANQLLLVLVLLMAFDATQMIYAGALRGAGDTLWPATITPLAAVVLMLGGGGLATAYFPQFGAVGPWLALTLYMMFIAVAFAGRFARGKWQRIVLWDKNQAHP